MEFYKKRNEGEGRSCSSEALTPAAYESPIKTILDFPASDAEIPNIRAAARSFAIFTN